MAILRTEELTKSYGGRTVLAALSHRFAPGEFVAIMGASPGAAVALTQMNAEIDVRNVLPSIRVPSLVIHRSEDQCLKVEEGRFVAERIPGAKFVELPGDDHLPFVGDQQAILDEIEKKLA